MSIPAELYFECFPFHCAVLVTGSLRAAYPPLYLFGPPMDAYEFRYRSECFPDDDIPREYHITVCAKHNAAFAPDFGEEGCPYCIGLLDPPDAETT